MSRYKMPKNRKQFEEMLLNAFYMGMQCSYCVEHTEKSTDERIYRDRFRALIQGKINTMSEYIDGEKLYTERMAGL